MTEKDVIIKSLESFDIEEVSAGETYNVQIFDGYRKGKKVTVEILDYGSYFDPSVRFLCKAAQNDGKITSGNGASNAEEAIEVVQWERLD